MRPWREKLNRILDQGAQLERLWVEFKPASLDLGKIEHILDQRQQRAARRPYRLRIGRLLRCQRSVEQQVGHAENSVKGSADIVGHHRQEPALGMIGGIGLPQFPFPVGQFLDAPFKRGATSPQAADRHHRKGAGGRNRGYPKRPQYCQDMSRHREFGPPIMNPMIAPPPCRLLPQTAFRPPSTAPWLTAGKWWPPGEAPALSVRTSHCQAARRNSSASAR